MKQEINDRFEVVIFNGAFLSAVQPVLDFFFNTVPLKLTRSKKRFKVGLD